MINSLHLERDIQADDIINCEDIRKEIGRRNMDNLVLNMCYQAQSQRQHEEQTRRQELEFAEQQALKRSRKSGATSMADFWNRRMGRTTRKDKAGCRG